jgi:hypothetical protein
MPGVVLRMQTEDGTTEETVAEYICDWPDCPNVAEHVLGVVREIRAVAMVCSEHAKLLASLQQR